MVLGKFLLNAGKKALIPNLKRLENGQFSESLHFASTKLSEDELHMSEERAYGKDTTCPPLVQGKFRLYSMRFCPYAQRSLLVLTAKDIPHDVVNINLADKPEWFLEKTSLEKVPVLEFNNTILVESLVIADYLDAIYSQRKLHPSDPLERAKRTILQKRFHKVAVSIIPVYRGEISIFEWWERFQNGIQYLEDELKNSGTTFFGGDTVGMIDYMIWPWFERVEAITIAYNLKPLSHKRFSHIQQWMANMSHDGAVQSVMVRTEDHIGYLNSIKEQNPNYDFGL